MGRDVWFRGMVEKVQTVLLALALLLATLTIIYFTVPDSYQFTSLLAFGIALLMSTGMTQLATQSRWRSRSLVVWVVLVHVVVILAVPFLSLALFPDWHIPASGGFFQSVPYSFANGLVMGLFLLVFGSVARLCVRWWSSWRDRGQGPG